MTKNIKLGDEVFTEMFTAKSIQQSILKRAVTWDDFCRTLLELFQESVKGLSVDVEPPHQGGKRGSSPE